MKLQYAEHGCDFQIVELFDKSKVGSLSEAKASERFMGEAYVDAHLKSSEWCQFNVPRIHVPEGMESMDAKENMAAAAIVDV